MSHYRGSSPALRKRRTMAYLIGLSSVLDISADPAPFRALAPCTRRTGDVSESLAGDLRAIGGDLWRAASAYRRSSCPDSEKGRALQGSLYRCYLAEHNHSDGLTGRVSRRDEQKEPAL